MIGVLTRKTTLGLGLGLLLAADPAGAQCDPDVDWTIYGATAEISEILIEGNTAWIGADGGLIQFDLNTASSGSPTQRKLDESTGLVSTDLSCLAVDGFGNVWAGTRESGISVFDSQGNHLKNLNSFDTLWSDFVLAIDSRGDRVYVQSADGFNAEGSIIGGGFVIVTVSQDGNGGYTFTAAPGPALEAGRFIHVDDDQVWFASASLGVWLRDESVVPPTLTQVLTSAEGLLSNNVRKLQTAPAFGATGDVLWIGSAEGLQTYDGVVVDTVSFFQGQNILDVHRNGNELLVISETDALLRDLYRIDLTIAPAPVRIGRIDCQADSLYTPREVAVDAAGRIVLGTRDRAFAVRDGGSWVCPPPLGPHASFSSDLRVAPDGTLYFGAGHKDPVGNDRGVGVFDGEVWSFIDRTNSDLIDQRITEIAVWPDSTLWFGSSNSAAFGGLNHYFPNADSMVVYHDDVVNPDRITVGRNVWALELDEQNNLWVCYGQRDTGGLSVIEWPSARVTNFPFGPLVAGTTNIRDIAFDTFGRVWASTFSSGTVQGQLYVLDTRGTLTNPGDDIIGEFNMANEVADIGDVREISIDSSNQIWLAGQTGLAVGQITDSGSNPAATWQTLPGTAAQLGGRNPLPFRVGALDWDENLWLGTENAGLVRISKDTSIWTWFDQSEGCPLPNQGVFGLYMDNLTRTVYVGTAGGIATVSLAGSSGAGSSDPQPYPNPWNPNTDGVLTFGGIPPNEITTLRFYSVSGELIDEVENGAGAKTWDGRNRDEQIVESGVYIVSGISTAGTATGQQKRYEGKVAVVR